MGGSKPKIRQLQHETATWKRNLEFIVQENVMLKNRLAEILNGKTVTNEFLEKAEKYQNDFTSEDEMVRWIRQDINELDRLLLKDQYLDGMIVEEEVIFKHKKLSKEIENVINQFNKLKFDFNNYMGSVL